MIISLDPMAVLAPPKNTLLRLISPEPWDLRDMLHSFTVNFSTFRTVPLPGVACKVTVLSAPVQISFSPAEPESNGFTVLPGTIIPVKAGDAMDAPGRDRQCFSGLLHAGEP